MNKATFIILLITATALLSISQAAQAHENEPVHRRANFSNEFNIYTPEGINARGYAVVYSRNSRHAVHIHANGLMPGATYVILNHWFEPIPKRGVPDSEGALVDPSCNGHFQFLGKPVKANKKGTFEVNVTVDQLAPHIWVANLAKFMEVTGNGAHAPVSADAFVTGGLMIPYYDIVEREHDFIDTDPLTDCGIGEEDM
jgi:hypothetical protein